MKRVIVCGGRDFSDLNLLEHVLSMVHARRGISCIIEGGQRGADRMAREWAIKCKIPFQTFEADWNGLGRRAGPIRNSEMLKNGNPDAVIAFPGGSGTNDMALKAEKAGIPVMRVSWEVEK